MEAKVATVTPILKSDEKIDKRNYRPVSIINSISKILENVLKERLSPILTTFYLLSFQLKDIQFATYISKNDRKLEETFR